MSYRSSTCHSGVYGAVIKMYLPDVLATTLVEMVGSRLAFHLPALKRCDE